MKKQITLSDRLRDMRARLRAWVSVDRLRTFRTWGIWGVFGVVSIDLITTAIIGPCGTKPDLFDWFQLVIAVLLLAQQFVIVGFSYQSRGDSDNTRFEWTWDLMWLPILIFGVAAQVNNIRFPFVFPGCS
jgi:hypothetical protein